ncbi:MAG: hypothetical protein HZB82_06740 [Deltaproteobacteria bacterium]|nr:hypothetical protein [Deltaproteobacteria bacterium]
MRGGLDVKFMDMKFPDISGAWLSKKEKHHYVITQVDDRFVYCFIHKNGVTETSIGLFLPANTEGKNIYVHVKWNRGGGKENAPVKSTAGRVVLEGKRATKIEWDDGDVYVKVL